MKKLYLLRHAESSHPQGVNDHNRPLGKQGKHECLVMRTYLQENNIKPELALCSDALRTTSTAKAIFAGIGDVNITYNKKLYNATPGEMFKAIAKVPDNINSIMVIAHNPGIQQLALILTGSGDKTAFMSIKADYPTCALTEFSVNVEGWSCLEPGVGALDRFVK